MMKILNNMSFILLALALASVTLGSSLRGSLPSNSDVSFSFIEGLTHSISDGEVDKHLCDASSPRSLAGYMDITGSKYDASGEDKHLFYWFFEKRGASVATDKSIPLVIWLTGGPGCSSSLALLTENGPCSVNEAGDGTIVNPYSWIESAHMLWLDQPAGVGYSYGKWTDHNEKMMGEDAYYFLQAFVKSHPEYSENPMFIVGESYGGHYAPAIAHRVFQENQEKKEGMEMLNLKGVAVGNGLTDPKLQYQHYPEMSFKDSQNTETVSEESYNECVDLIDQCNKASQLDADFLCQEAYNFCESKVILPYFETFSNIHRFLHLDSTKKALHVSPKSIGSIICNNSINRKFRTGAMDNFAFQVADLLEGGIPVLIYAGDTDFVSNYMGNKALTLSLDWEFREDFNQARDHMWGAQSGLVRSSHGLTFLQLHNAGHIVSADQPKASLKLISEFIFGEEF